MREIKFRAWDKENKEMVEFDFGEVDDGMCFAGTRSLDLIGIDAVPVMQFTGLLDKNSVEIFEGDILKNNYPGLSLLKVVYGRGGFAIVAVDLEELLSELLNPDNSLYKTSEIIGNIYENPELLKEAK
jgi:uncharacterized phage protein (TIGR01671 family)